MTRLAASAVLLLLSPAALAADIKGKVVDKASGEALIGATVMLGNEGAVTDAEGRFRFTGLAKGRYTLQVSYLAYRTTLVDNVAAKDAEDAAETVVEMEEDRQTLGEGGFAVFCSSGDEDNHFFSSTVNLSPSRISSR